MANFTDSVAIAVINDDTILQGVGNKVKILRTKSQDFKLYDLHFRDKIHGIEHVSDGTTTRICAYGGRFLAICEVNPEEEEQIRILSRCKLSDVISSARINPKCHNTIDLVTTYNVALRLELDSDNNLVITKKSVCVERSTLYCAHIRYGDTGGDWTDLRIFGGTAFGEVLQWSPTVEGISSISYRFSTPRGVLFSITTSEDCRQLITTSDDRSVRFWKISWNRKENRIEDHQLDLTCFGHLGRVFKSVLTEYQGTKYLISVGEDSRICCWDLQGNLVFRRDIQTGATLWNVTVANGFIYATGSNGGLEVVSFERGMDKSESYSIENLFTNEYPAKIRFVSPEKLICITDSNSLKLITRDGDSWNITSSIQLDLRSTVLEVNGDMIAVGGFGQVSVFMCQGSELVLFGEFKEINSLVRSIHWLGNGDKLLVVNNQGEGYLLSQSMAILKRITLTHGSQRWTTSAILITTYLLVSDRHGNLYSFDCSGDSMESTPVSYLRRVHGLLGITGMYAITGNCLLTTGHDSMIRTIHLEESTGELCIWRSQRLPIKWIERITGDLVMGFNDNHFTIWNRKDQRILGEIDCGGGHRFWDIVTDEDSGECGQFVFIKNRQLHLTKISLVSNRSCIQNGISFWHTTSTNCLKICQLSGSQFVLSGGEEGLIKIHECIDGELFYRDQLTAHIANIRSMAIKVLDETSILLFSGGGRAQLCLHQLTNTPSSGLVIRERANFMFKGSDLDRERKGKNQSVDFDPETRLMSLVMDEDQIFVGCSDGYLRSFQYNETTMEVSLSQEFFYGKCVLQMGIVNLQSGNPLLLSMATDGKINLWNKKTFGDLLGSLSHHESGINAFDCRGIPGSADEFWVVTGGDDQAVVASRIKVGEDAGSVEVLSTYKSLYLHTAQLSGVCILNDCSEFISTALDQEIYLHCLNSEQKTSNLSFTSVADPKGLALIDEHRVLIYGAGVEVLELL